MKCKNCVRYVHLNDDGERTIGTPNWCFYLNDSPDEEMERDCKVFKSLTNADHIRQMTDEDLAMLLQPGCPSRVCRDCPPHDCYNCWLEWLKQEATNDQNNS